MEAALSQARPVMDALSRIAEVARPHVLEADRQLEHSLRPHQVFLLGAVVALLIRWVLATLDELRHAEVKKSFFKFIKRLPIMRSYAAAELGKIDAKMQHMIRQKLPQDAIVALPAQGLPKEEVLARMRKELANEAGWKEGLVSGTVYHGSEELKSLLDAAHCMFSTANPLHPDVFPGVRRFESECVRMAVTLLNGDEEACGIMTASGTESILLAIKAARDWARETKGITKPEIVAPVSAHAAVDKAGHYLGIRVIKVPVGKDYRADLRAMRRAITRNTILVYASAPGFPHGVIDNVEAIGAMAKRAGCCLHVDCCLGGFLLPFARKLGYPVPPFDYLVPGVTSISADTHKYGFAQKGTSVLSFRTRELRRFVYYSVTDWPGGLYATAGVPGSRPGGPIATVWAAMVHLGEKGYMEVADKIMKTMQAIVKGIGEIEGLRLVGNPDACVVAFTSDTLDIFAINDVLSKRGWHLNALHKPACLHVCVTLPTTLSYQRLLSDLREAVREVAGAGAGASKEGMAPIYGMAASVPDRGAINDVLARYLDALYLTR
eukprot:tig00000823_g4549.t1